MASDLALADGSDSDVPRRLPHPGGAPALGRAQKAAIVVRLLLAEGVSLPLSDLPDALQAELAQQISQMRFVDRATLHEVLEEFATELDSIGLSFPGGLEGALAMLDGAISPELAQRMRNQSGALWDDPWTAIRDLPSHRLRDLLQREGTEIGAVILSKLPVAVAAECLAKLPGPVARRLTLGVSETGSISPEAVRRIGLALVAETKARPPQAFTAEAVDRLGAILDISPAPTREDVLSGLAEEDEDLAERVRAAIFTFADIPERVDPKDVPTIASAIDQDVLLQALAGSDGDGASERARDHILDNLPGRLADNLRVDMDELTGLDPAKVEDAMIATVKAIRKLADADDIELRVRDIDRDA